MQTLTISTDSKVLLKLSHKNGQTFLEESYDEDMKRAANRWISNGIHEWIYVDSLSSDSHDLSPRATPSSSSLFLKRLIDYLSFQFDCFTYSYTEE